MVSVIVPVWNDAACLRTLLAKLSGETGRVEIIVVDGGSGDGVVTLVEQFPRVRFLRCARGRGRQMNTGARAARGGTLLFLHSDTVPPVAAMPELPDLLRSSNADFGAFQLRFDPPCLVPGLLARFTRLAKPWACFGDQGIFVDRRFFLATGGFPEIPILEEVHWLRKARGMGSMVRSRHTVVTSARRFRERGQVRQTLLNAWILLLDRFGADPAHLAKLYELGTWRSRPSASQNGGARPIPGRPVSTGNP